MIEIVPYNEDITCIKTATEHDGQAIMFVYAYLVRDALFDAGCANALEEMRGYTQKVSINSLYVTHSHEDHVGCCSIFDDKIPIYANGLTQKTLRAPPQYGEFFKWAWGQPEPVLTITELPERFIIGNLSFEVIPIPGHTMEMVGFYEPDKKWFFSADAIPLPSKKKIAMPDENVPLMVSTMEKILEFHIDILFDSHRGPITSPREHIQTRINFIRGIQSEVLALHEQGKSIEEIQAALGFEVPWYIELTERRFGIDFLIKSLLFDRPEVRTA